MNKFIHSKNLPGRRPLIAMSLAMFFLASTWQDRAAEPKEPGRFLFVFTTSKEMKARCEATEKAVNSMLATGLRGQLHAGDSVGVWTLGQDLKTSGFPLQSWNPEAAVLIASNIVKFANKQRYAKNTRFDLLPSVLNQVVKNSERLTVLIFCDGEDKITGTPFDAAINQVFQEKVASQKKANEPIIIVLRSQLGQYAGCTATIAPMPLNIPDFPPLPEPTHPPAPKSVVVMPPPAPTLVVPPLIIVGKKVSDHLPPVDSSPPVTAMQTNVMTSVTDVTQVVQSVTQTNSPAPLTNVVVVKVTPSLPTNAIPAISQNSNSSHQSLMLIGAGLIGAAAMLGLVLVLRPRPKETSLITRSMNNPK